MMKIVFNILLLNLVNNKDTIKRNKRLRFTINMGNFFSYGNLRSTMRDAVYSNLYNVSDFTSLPVGVIISAVTIVIV